MNYSYLRNPPEHVCRIFPERSSGGLARVNDRLEERRFLDALYSVERAAFKPLFLIVGGFMDGVRGHAYGIRRYCPDEILSRCDVFYRQYPEHREIGELTSLYASLEQKIILLGHSWGADALVHHVLKTCHVPVTLLVTLDPVSRKRVPRERLPQVQHWLNIRLDYNRATWFDYTNTIARIGRPWGHVPAADMEIVCGEGVRHASAARMFSRYALEHVLQCLH